MEAPGNNPIEGRTQPFGCQIVPLYNGPQIQNNLEGRTLKSIKAGEVVAGVILAVSVAGVVASFVLPIIFNRPNFVPLSVVATLVGCGAFLVLFEGISPRIKAFKNLSQNPETVANRLNYYQLKEIVSCTQGILRKVQPDELIPSERQVYNIAEIRLAAYIDQEIKKCSDQTLGSARDPILMEVKSVSDLTRAEYRIENIGTPEAERFRRAYVSRIDRLSFAIV